MTPEEEPPANTRANPHCWACGTRCPRRTWLDRVGWVQRPVRLAGGTFRETYCPACFARWGWPDEVKGTDR